MKLVTQLWLRKRIFLFLGNTYGSLQGSVIMLSMPHPQTVQKTNYVYPHREKEGDRKENFMSIIMKHKANAECNQAYHS